MHEDDGSVSSRIGTEGSGNTPVLERVPEGRYDWANGG